MVVTRKAPVPPTPTSRTTSSQPVSRVAKGKSVPNTPEQSSPLANGKSRTDTEQDLAKNGPNSSAESESPKKGKPKSKWRRKTGKKSKKGRSRSLFDFLSNVFITGIIIYALFVCPNNPQTPQPYICHSISEYRRLLLEPYILPAVHHVLAHPSVAPYVEVVQPHVNHALAVAKPMAIRLQNELNTRLIPQYNAYVAPQLHKVEEQLQPYRILAEKEYDRYVGPYIRRTTVTLWRWQHQARPYVVLAANKSHDGYHAAQPYFKPVLQQFKVIVLRLVQFAGQYRRQFVDPHVAKMWIKIKELSSGKESAPLSPIEATPTPSYSVQHEVLETAAEILVEESTSTATTSLAELTAQPMTAFLTSINDVVTETETETSSVADVTPEAVNLVHGAESENIQIPIETPDDVISAETTTGPAVSETEFRSFSPSSEETSPQETFSKIFVSTPTSLDSSGPSPTPQSSDYDEVDLNAFYAELGLHEPVSESPEHENQVPFSAPPQESEEERAARLTIHKEEVAKKRKEITERHSKWELELEELIVEKKKSLKRSLLGLRKAAAIELKENADIRTAVEGLVADAEKYLKGAEGYLKNLSKEDRKGEEKNALWTRVVDKVDEKFTGRLRETEVVVNGWYGLVVDAEMAEVMKATAPIQVLVERAQADIGLDYAWLDDVTTQDWQRYHDLMRRSEDFSGEATMLQNGTHASSPTNPVTPAINDLRAEVEDIIVGFETRLRRIKRNGDRAFGNIRTDGQTEVDNEEPEVSILPIDPEEELVEDAIPPVVIGKSQEQVLEALGHAGVNIEDGTIPSSSSSPQEEVDEIVKEAEAESASSLHEEL